MGSLSNTLEGSSGTTVSNANSAGPNQFNTVSVTGAGTTLAYDNAHAHAGATSAKAVLATVSSTAYLDWSVLPNTPTANAYCRFYAYLTALPSVNAVLCKFLSGASVESTLQLQTTGFLRTLTAAGGQISALTESFPLNQWVRVEFEVTGISGVNGTVACRIFSGANLEGTTPDTGGSVSASSAALTGTVSDLRVGTSSAVVETSAFTYWLDDVAYSDVATPGAAYPFPVIITAPRVPVAPARPAAAQVITAPVAGGVPPATASLAGAGAVTANVTQAATASLAGAGAVTAKVTQIATASLAGAGAVTANATQAATAALAGAGAVTANATQIATASLAGAGAVTAASSTTAAAPPSVLITVTQPPPVPPRAAGPQVITAPVPAPVLLVNDFEEGTSGTTVTPGNSAGTGESAFDTVTVGGTGATLIFDNAHAAHGTLSAKVRGGTSATLAQWRASFPVSAQLWFRIYLYFTANPTGPVAFFAFVDSAGATLFGNLAVNVTGHLTGLGLPNFTTAIPLNAWCRVEGSMLYAGAGAVSTTEVKLFLTKDSTTADETHTISNASLTSPPAGANIPYNANITTGDLYWADDVAISNVGYIGPAAGATTATASPAGAGTVTANAGQAATASLAGAGAVTDVVTQAVTAALAGAGSVTANATSGTTATIAAAGAVTAVATVIAPATVAGAGAVTANATQAVTAGVAGAGAVTAVSGTVTAAPAPALLTVTQPSPAPPAPPRPRILPQVQQDFLVVLGDMQPAQHTTAPPTVVAAQIAGLSPQPGFVLIAGDCTNDGDNTGFTGEFTNLDSMYGGIKAILRPVPGNHDWGNVVGSGNLTAYDTYWGAQAHSGATPPHFYSFDTPTGWHVVALDSDEQWVGSLNNPSATYTALAADLAANTGKPIIAYWHHPRFSDGTNATDPGGTADTTTVQDIWNLLRDYACDLVFTGHCHSYQRFPKLGKTGSADAAGIREFVVGTGGSGLFALTAAPGAGARSDVNSWQSGAYDQLNSQWFGFLKLYLTPSTYSWQFVSQNAVASQNPGAVLDSGGPVPTNLSQGAVQPQGLGTASLAGAGSVTAKVTQAATASPAGAGTLTANVTQAAPAVLAGAGVLGPVPATEAVTASPAGAAAVTAAVTQIATASLAGAGAVTAVASSGGPSTAALAGAGAVAAVATVAAPATAAGAAAVGAAAAQAAKATAAGTGAVGASGQITGTASLAAAGTVTAKTAQPGTASLAGAGTLAALAAQRATATLAGTGALTAASSQQVAFTIGTLTGSTAATATLAAAGAATSALSGSTAPSSAITATTTRTGGPSA